jgi:PAS domain S-box-containing protein
VFDRQEIERAAAEEVLRQMPAAVLIAEAPSGEIIFRNRVAQHTRERSLKEAWGTYLEDACSFQIYHPDGRPYETQEWPLMRSITDGEEVRDEEFVYPLADGSELFIRCNSSPLYDDEGRIVAGIVVAYDITEQKRAEAELKESEERFRATFEQAAVGIAHNALDGSWLRVNQRLCDILGYTREELLQKTFQEITYPDDLDADLEQTRRLLAGEINTFTMEKRYIRKDGSVVWINLTVSLVREPSGDPGYFIAVIEDISERKQVEGKLEEVREAERSRIARDLHDEPLQELTDALVQLQQLQRTSKDSQQSLRLARLLATLDRIGPQQRGAIYDLRLSGEQSRHFSELLEALVELHRGMAPHSEITLEVHDGVLEGPLGERGRQLLRIVGEALTNVRRHSGAKNVGVGLGITEEKLWAEVSDDGVGFDAARQQEQREEQDSEEALSAPGGLGLRGMVERARALGGDLTIESDPHSGTMVRFEMPLGTTTRVPEEPAGAAAGGGEPEEQELEAAAAVRVLLVEDHAAVREALASSFQREQGFEVVAEASTLEQAREKMLDEIEVAVIDLGLPDGYGGDLIKDLRDANPRAQALVLSASLERGEIARAVEAGAAAVLSKTAHLDEVVGAIKRLRAGEPLMTLEEVVELLRFAGSRREEELEARRSVEKLTAREVEVLQALAEGLGSEQIAQRLHISLRTERNHMANILSKLGVHSQLQALVFALRHGVVEVR